MRYTVVYHGVGHPDPQPESHPQGGVHRLRREPVMYSCAWCGKPEDRCKCDGPPPEDQTEERPDRERFEDDGQEYGDPRDFMEGRE